MHLDTSNRQYPNSSCWGSLHRTNGRPPRAGDASVCNHVTCKDMKGARADMRRRGGQIGRKKRLIDWNCGRGELLRGLGRTFGTSVCCHSIWQCGLSQNNDNRDRVWIECPLLSQLEFPSKWYIEKWGGGGHKPHILLNVHRATFVHNSF